MITIRVQVDDFDLSTELANIRRDNPSIGAVAAFVGVVRDLSAGSAVSGLELEHYPGMTDKVLADIVAEAASRWEVLGCTIIHRVGALQPLDQIVLVVVASGHRGDAFTACEFIMDYLKTRAPFWKKETTPDGSRWVEARDSDDEAATRWTS